MSGHSKWATIKRAKAATDAKRGQAFTKVIKEITVAARVGGGDASGNPRLRLAIEKAKAANMPTANVERAIKRGTGELEGVSYEEVRYEGYGPGGVALLVDTLTDNKNRTVAELRNLLTKKGGNLGESNSVAWMFHRKGAISFDASQYSEDQIMESLLDAGAEDIASGGQQIDVTTAPEDFDKVKKAAEAAKLNYLSAELSMIPETTIKLAHEDADRMLKLMEALEDHDDVQHIYANFDIADDIIKSLG